MFVSEKVIFFCLNFKLYRWFCNNMYTLQCDAYKAFENSYAFHGKITYNGNYGHKIKS